MLFLLLNGAKEIKGRESTRVGEEAAHTPVAQVLSPCLRSFLRPREVGLLSFAEDVLAAVFSSHSPHLETACQAMARHTGKTRRRIRKKKREEKKQKARGG